MPSFPSDVLLPATAKYYSFVDTTKAYNPQYDITWSFDFALSATNLATQYAFSTFLSPTPSLLSSVPGHYIGVPGEIIYLLTETGDYLLTESGERLIYSTNLSGAIVSIALDSTGLFALSSSALYDRPGVARDKIYNNALVVRDNNQNVIFNQPLSGFTSMHSLCSSKSYQTIRVRYANAGRKLSIDYRPTSSTTYSVLTSFRLPTAASVDRAYVGFAYTTPVSSTASRVADLYIKNFHIEGNTSATTYEALTSQPLSSAYLSTYHVLSGVTVTAKL